MTKEQAANNAERALWTGAQVALGLLVTDLADIETWWALPLAALFSSAKTWVQDRLHTLGGADG